MENTIMKFKFKIQQYQTEAVENTVAVFTGQPSHTMAEYRRDLGRRQQQQIEYEGETGFRNHRIELEGGALLKNINSIQNLYDITPSTSLAKGVGAVNLDIEMETGTGKTYVYINHHLGNNHNGHNGSVKYADDSRSNGHTNGI